MSLPGLDLFEDEHRVVLGLGLFATSQVVGIQYALDIYQSRREDIKGTVPNDGLTVFEKIWTSTLEEIQEMKDEYANYMNNNK